MNLGAAYWITCVHIRYRTVDRSAGALADNESGRDINIGGIGIVRIEIYPAGICAFGKIGGVECNGRNIRSAGARNRPAGW